MMRTLDYETQLLVAVEKGIINLSQDQRTFHWGSNDRKLLTVPFDENPYSAIASWFKTDEGVEVFQNNSEKVTIICNYNYSEGSLWWP